MRRREDALLQTALDALKAAEPENAQMTASARRVAERLGIDSASGIEHDAAFYAIESCEDVQRLLGSYRAGTLPGVRALLIEAHLRDCGACRRRSVGGVGAATVDWSAPKAVRAVVWRPRALGWTLAGSFAVLVLTFFLYRSYWQVPPGVRAEVQSIDGSAYLISATGERQLVAGDQLTEGERLRTSGGAHAVLRLVDGSTVEMNQRSVLGVGARGRNTTVTLDDGAVIVQAAKRDDGHLYVKTPDCRVAVTGTVFSVDAGLKGSRVAVLQGSVYVMHAGVETLVQAGDQVSTSDNLSPAPVNEQIAWSHEREKYLPLLAQLSTLQRRIQSIPMPQLRYTSDLWDRVPSNTLLYISIPNLGDFLSEANRIFLDQLQKSPALQQWWNQGHNDNTAELNSLVDKLHQMSHFLGDEIVIAGVKGTGEPGFAIIADVKQDGLQDFLSRQFPATHHGPGIVVMNQDSLAGAPASQKNAPFALIREHEVILSNRIAVLMQVNAQLNAGASGFAAGDFGQLIAAAYRRGAGIIVAADLHQMIGEAQKKHAGRNGSEAFNRSGINDVRYLIAEHRDMNGHPENRLNLQFAEARQGVASWLAAPAPMGSLEFVTPNAAIAVAMLSKDPKAIADDLMKMADADKGQKDHSLSDAETKLQINFRDDLAANLGGEFLLALDGPVLPTPAWKAVIEVRDPERLEQTLERLTESIRNQAQDKGAHAIVIEASDADGQRFYAMRDAASGNIVAQYTFSNGYMIAAPNRAIVMEALHTFATGDSLARSEGFRALLPKDQDENYSAVAYQNLSPVLTPLLSNLSGEEAAALRELAADARPTVICARGEENRIQVASDSHLFGFDFLAFQTLISSGNKHGAMNVRE